MLTHTSRMLRAMQSEYVEKARLEPTREAKLRDARRVAEVTAEYLGELRRSRAQLQQPSLGDE